MKVGAEDLSATVGNDQRTVEGVQEACNQLKNLLVIGVLFRCGCLRQRPVSRLQPANPNAHSPLLSENDLREDRMAMLAKGPRGVNGKCVLLCTIVEAEGNKTAAGPPDTLALCVFRFCKTKTDIQLRNPQVDLGVAFKLRSKRQYYDWGTDGHSRRCLATKIIRGAGL
jgi:hypothetical protein